MQYAQFLPTYDQFKRDDVYLLRRCVYTEIKQRIEMGYAVTGNSDYHTFIVPLDLNQVYLEKISPLDTASYRGT